MGADARGHRPHHPPPPDAVGNRLLRRRDRRGHHHRPDAAQALRRSRANAVLGCTRPRPRSMRGRAPPRVARGVSHAPPDCARSGCAPRVGAVKHVDVLQVVERNQAPGREQGATDDDRVFAAREFEMAGRPIAAATRLPSQGRRTDMKAASRSASYRIHRARTQAGTGTPAGRRSGHRGGWARTSRRRPTARGSARDSWRRPGCGARQGELRAGGNLQPADGRIAQAGEQQSRGGVVRLEHDHEFARLVALAAEAVHRPPQEPRPVAGDARHETSGGRPCSGAMAAPRLQPIPGRAWARSRAGRRRPRSRARRASRGAQDRERARPRLGVDDADPVADRPEAAGRLPTAPRHRTRRSRRRPRRAGPRRRSPAPAR